MDELASLLNDARRTVDPAWDLARSRKARDAFHRRLAQRKRVRVASAFLAPALVLVPWLVMRLADSTRDPAPVARHAPSAVVVGSTRARADGPFRFWDGSTATPIDAAARLRAAEVSPSRIVVDVERGSGRFEVTPGRVDRAFVVRSAGVTVRVVGTAFTVAREETRTRVSVEHGRVSVEWRGGQRYLVEGESDVFPPLAEGGPEGMPVDAPSASDDGAATPAPRSAANWRRLAESGDFNEAFAALAGAEVRDRPEELLLAADAARLSGHPREALPYYQRVLRDHVGDPRAPLAAFTMGRVLLTQLGRPREAATAFARARELSGGGSIAEDALAREVEARSLAGETERARGLAEDYVARYPSGQRIRAVRRFGGLP